MKCSVRCAFRLSRKQEGAIECVAQFQSSKGVTSEVCDGDDIREGGSVLYKMSGSSRVIFTIPFANPKFGAP